MTAMPNTFDHDWYRCMREAVSVSGFASEIRWAQRVGAPESADDFASELIFVICSSGMREQVARKIYDGVMAALRCGLVAGDVFRHRGKARSINHVWYDRESLFDQYKAAGDKLAWLAGVDWIGPITKYHAARNLGLDVIKPDRHLVRIAAAAGTTPDDLCARMAADSGDRIGVVDIVLWRASNLGIINTKALAP
jgi:hypothetical protein